MTRRSHDRPIVMGSDESWAGVGRALGWGGAGGLGALLFSILWGTAPRPWPPAGLAPPADVWVCDRDGQRILGLDGDALPVQQRIVRQPLEVAPGPGNGLWVLRALGSGGVDGRELLRLDAQGLAAGHLKLRGARCLGAGPGGAARLLGQLGQEWYWLQLDSAGRAIFAIPAGNALGWEALPEALVLVGPDWVRRYHWSPLGSARVAVRELRLSPSAPVLAQASSAGRLWLLLAGEEAPLLVELDEQWQCLARRALEPWPLDGEEAWFLAPAPDGAMWVVGGSGHVSRVQTSGRGERRTRLMGPIHAARCRADELWCASGGGVQRLDREVRAMPGQGGLNRLTQLCVVQSVLQGP